MSPELAALVEKAFTATTACAIAMHSKDAEAVAILQPEAETAYNALVDRLRAMEHGYRPVPDFYRRDQEPIGADPTLAGAVRYTR